MKQIMENWRRLLNEEEASPSEELAPEDQEALKTFVDLVLALQTAVDDAGEEALVQEARPGTAAGRARSRKRRAMKRRKALRAKADDYVDYEIADTRPGSYAGSPTRGVEKADMTPEQLKIYRAAYEYLTDPLVQAQKLYTVDPLQLPGVKQIIKFTGAEKVLRFVAGSAICQGGELSFDCLAKFIAAQPQTG